LYILPLTLVRGKKRRWDMYIYMNVVSDDGNVVKKAEWNEKSKACVEVVEGTIWV